MGALKYGVRIENIIPCLKTDQDAGGLASSRPDVVLRPESLSDLRCCLEKNSREKKKLVIRGAGMTTEGESLARKNECLVDMRGLNRIRGLENIDGTPHVRVEAGASFQQIDAFLEKEKLSLISAPLSFSATVGGTLAVGGIDVNSAFQGSFADQVREVRLFLASGEQKICSLEENADLFEDTLYGYGQFSVVGEVLFPVKARENLRLEYLYYHSLERAVIDLMHFAARHLADQLAVLSLRDDVTVLILGFESGESFESFQKSRHEFSGMSEKALWLSKAISPFKKGLLFRLPFLWKSRQKIFSHLKNPAYYEAGFCRNRLQMFSRLVWDYWGKPPVVIPDISLRLKDLVPALLQGNELCRKTFPYYTIYVVLVRKNSWSRRYNLGPFPRTEERLLGGLEFEPLQASRISPRKLQDFKDEVYKIGKTFGGRAYRFGGLMKKHIPDFCGPKEWQDFLLAKKRWDPDNRLNPRVILPEEGRREFL
jgi:FAD/FMN-containing dehydrogenase